MTNSDRTSQERVLRDAIREINPQQARAIRDAYYKAVEGLQALTTILEITDLENGDRNDHALLQEHLLACEAMETMGKNLLGRIV